MIPRLFMWSVQQRPLLFVGLIFLWLAMALQIIATLNLLLLLPVGENNIKGLLRTRTSTHLQPRSKLHTRNMEAVPSSFYFILFYFCSEMERTGSEVGVETEGKTSVRAPSFQWPMDPQQQYSTAQHKNIIQQTRQDQPVGKMQSKAR
ncbi:MAG: hypothetical protein JOS17DRAFT_227833 [Linnemannia elongata]|nr:MAG: hypothetical protein JOS17DRAFT_227833 [Linnemannia elongata]